MPRPQHTVGLVTGTEVGKSVRRQAPQVSDTVLRFSNGEISRAQAMRSLGVGYSELLDRVADRNLPLPRVSDAEADRMAKTLLDLIGTAAP